MKKNLENLSIEEKAWECMRVEYKEYRENPKDFGETTTALYSFLGCGKCLFPA